jgi:hypothetical protein
VDEVDVKEVVEDDGFVESSVQEDESSVHDDASSVQEDESSVQEDESSFDRPWSSFVHPTESEGEDDEASLRRIGGAVDSSQHIVRVAVNSKLNRSSAALTHARLVSRNTQSTSTVTT